MERSRLATLKKQTKGSSAAAHFHKTASITWCRAVWMIMVDGFMSILLFFFGVPLPFSFRWLAGLIPTFVFPLRPLLRKFWVVAFVSRLAAHLRVQFGNDFAAKPRSVTMAWA